MSEILFNKLDIIAGRKQVKEVRDFLKGKPSKEEPNMFIDFNKIIPSPNESEEFADWNYDNWGTKWNAFYQKSRKSSQITFATMNCPVPFLINELSCKFPDVIFLYQFDDPEVIGDPEVFLFIKNGIDTEIPRNCFLPDIW